MSKTYELLPFDPSPSRADIVSSLLRKVAATDSIFSETSCDGECFEKTHQEMCGGCLGRLRVVASTLTAPSTRAWEVWDETPEAVGVIFFTDITALDAKAHYVFFDNRLSDKTETMKEVIAFAFEDAPEEGWTALRRLTIEIPETFAALARHASKRLGFGGSFRRTLKGGYVLGVEGVKEKGARWKGEEVDLLILGLLRTTPKASSTPPQDPLSDSKTSQPRT